MLPLNIQKNDWVIEKDNLVKSEDCTWKYKMQT